MSSSHSVKLTLALSQSISQSANQSINQTNTGIFCSGLSWIGSQVMIGRCSWLPFWSCHPRSTGGLDSPGWGVWQEGVLRKSEFLPGQQMIGPKALSSSEAGGSETSNSSQNKDLEQTDKKHGPSHPRLPGLTDWRWGGIHSSLCLLIRHISLLWLQSLCTWFPSGKVSGQKGCFLNESQFPKDRVRGQVNPVFGNF